MEQEIDWEQELYGSGYRQLDRERDRKKKREFWAALDGTSGVALMVDWVWTFGSAVDVILPFIELTGEKTESFPCPAESPCGCRHAIGETSRGEITVACCCSDWDCGMYEVQPEDLLFHRIDMDRFGEAIGQALGFAAPSATPYTSAGLREIGRYTPAAVPVYLSLVSEAGLAREMARLLGLREGPFLVLTATGRSWDPEVEAMARPHAGGHISLSSVLDASAAGFTSKGTVEPMLAEFVKRVASLRDSGGTLKSIHREIARVGKDVEELRTAKQRLEKMLADGMFAFTKKVDATSFKVLCTILAEGNVSKASRSLGMADSTLRDMLAKWRGKGGAYKTMLDLVRWRKKVGRRDTVALDESVVLGKPDCGDHPALLSDVLEGLLSMTEDNWQELSGELAELIRAS